MPNSHPRLMTGPRITASQARTDRACFPGCQCPSWCQDRYHCHIEEERQPGRLRFLATQAHRAVLPEDTTAFSGPGLGPRAMLPLLPSGSSPARFCA